MKYTLFVAATVGAAALATQVLAASGEACLTRSRLQSWRAFDDSTVIMTDRLMNQFTVRLNNRCTNLTRPTAQLTYRSWQNLSCLQSGEIITVRAPGLGAVTCSVASVESGLPETGPTTAFSPQRPVQRR